MSQKHTAKANILGLDVLASTCLRTKICIDLDNSSLGAISPQVMVDPTASHI